MQLSAYDVVLDYHYSKGDPLEERRPLEIISVTANLESSCFSFYLKVQVHGFILICYDCTFVACKL